MKREQLGQCGTMYLISDVSYPSGDPSPPDKFRTSAQFLVLSVLGTSLFRPSSAPLSSSFTSCNLVFASYNNCNCLPKFSCSWMQVCAVRCSFWSCSDCSTNWLFSSASSLRRSASVVCESVTWLLRYLFSSLTFSYSSWRSFGFCASFSSRALSVSIFLFNAEISLSLLSSCHWKSDSFFSHEVLS